MAFKLGMTVDSLMAYNYAHARINDLDFDAISIKRATTVGHFL